jgi:hypothetical protein
MITQDAIDKEFDVLATKSYADIQRETAVTWGARAINAFKIAVASKANAPDHWLTAVIHGEDYFQEAVEHAALVEDKGATVKLIQEDIDPYRQAALKCT